MKTINAHRLLGKAVIALLVCGAISLAGTLPAAGHGGKSHGNNEFTSLQALQKATQLYDRLISSGKLHEAWETTLNTIAVSKRQSNNEDEYIVRFQRAEGEPDSVYFFFDSTGTYSGSNFTGQ